MRSNSILFDMICARHRYLGVNGSSAGGYIPAPVAAEMAAFVHEQLLVPHWMRALSLQVRAPMFICVPVSLSQ